MIFGRSIKTPDSRLFGFSDSIGIAFGIAFGIGGVEIYDTVSDEV